MLLANLSPDVANYEIWVAFMDNRSQSYFVVTRYNTEMSVNITDISPKLRTLVILIFRRTRPN